MAGSRVYDPYPEGSQPPYRSERYGRTAAMGPDSIQAPLRTSTELSGPVFQPLDDKNRDLVHENGGVAVGSLMRLVVRVLDEDARPQRNSLVEIWQANAAGKYQHPQDDRDAPLDKHFRTWGRAVTDENGEVDFLTIRPGAYPVPNGTGWWRPPHIHISAYGDAFASRIITQMYFPGDPLNDIDGILQGIPDASARDSLILKPDSDVGLFEQALGFRFDMVLRGRAETPTEAR